MKKLFMLLLTLVSMSVSAQDAVQYFNAGNPIEFMGRKYFFVWSSRPYDFYIMQEYLPAGQDFNTYEDMFTVSVMFYGETPFDSHKALEMKVAELEERKKTDPCCDYVVADVNDVKVLDFTVSDATGKDKKPKVLEADIHYYRDVEIGGIKASVLSYYSHRYYGKDIKKSLKEFPKQCDGWNRQIVALALTPEVSLKK